MAPPTMPRYAAGIVGDDTLYAYCLAGNAENGAYGGFSLDIEGARICLAANKCRSPICRPRQFWFAVRPAVAGTPGAAGRCHVHAAAI